MSDRLSIGVIGCGYWGPNLIRNFEESLNARMAAVCDLDEERLDYVLTRNPGMAGFSNYGELVRSGGVDAVAVATPVATHYAIAKAALEAGKHVLIEKPMAASSEECEDLIRIADERELTLMVGHTFLYSEPIRKVIDIIKRGELGELRYINSQRLSLGLFQKDVNVAWDLAPHDLSIVLRAIGNVPLVVNCQGNANVTPGVEDVANISLKFQNDTFATIQNSWLEPRKVRQITFVGTQRTIIFDDLEPREKVKIHDVRVDRPPHYDNFNDFHYAYHYGDIYIPRFKQTEPLRELVEHFIECVRTGRTPLTCGRRGLEVVRILEATTESLQAAGGPVPFSRADDYQPMKADELTVQKASMMGAI